MHTSREGREEGVVRGPEWRGGGQEADTLVQHTPTGRHALGWAGAEQDMTGEEGIGLSGKGRA